MARVVDIIDYFPKILKEYREIMALAETENIELNLQWQAIEDFYNDMFVDSLTENGCSRQESMLSLTSKDTDTLTDRRFRIKVKLNEQLPYTYNVLKQQLAILCGDDGYSLVVDGTTYTITVRVDLAEKEQYDSVATLVDKMRPCNMIVDLSLLYNQHKTLANFTHGNLGEYTHKELREEVLI
jgi:hypothetical protein